LGIVLLRPYFSGQEHAENIPNPNCHQGFYQ
jgi:hypothetical protein